MISGQLWKTCGALMNIQFSNQTRIRSFSARERHYEKHPPVHSSWQEDSHGLLFYFRWKPSLWNHIYSQFIRCFCVQSPRPSITQWNYAFNSIRDSISLHALDINRVVILILFLHIERVRHGRSIWQVARFRLDIVGLSDRDRLTFLDYDNICLPMIIGVSSVGINPLLHTVKLL